MFRPLRLTLTALSSQYIHMPLAPFCLRKAVEDALPGLPVTICDLNINDTQEDLLARIMATEPDVLGVSLYIWNRLCAAQLIRRVKALIAAALPHQLPDGAFRDVLDDPTMPDFEYDHLLRELEELEAMFEEQSDDSCFLTEQPEGQFVRGH